MKISDLIDIVSEKHFDDEEIYNLEPQDVIVKFQGSCSTTTTSSGSCMVSSTMATMLRLYMYRHNTCVSVLATPSFWRPKVSLKFGTA